MSRYEVVSRRLYPSRGVLEGGLPCSPSLFCRECDLRAQNGLRLQLNPLQLAQVMDTAASKLLRTGTYKLHPPLIVIVVREGLCR